MENIKAVIFDMDGVITETSEMHFIAWRDMARSIGIDIDLEFNERLKGISRRDSIIRILEYGNKVDMFSEEQIQKMMFDKNEHYKSLIQSYTKEQLNPGIYELMHDLKNNKIKVGIASASKSAPMLVENLGISDCVDYIVDPATVPGKPAPDLFLKAAEMLGVDVKDCIGVEDAEAGVEAIKSAHMIAVGIGSENVLKKADIVLEKTRELTLELLYKL